MAGAGAATTCLVAAVVAGSVLLRAFVFAAACFGAAILVLFFPLFAVALLGDGVVSDLTGPRALDAFTASSTFAVTSSVHRTPRPVRAAGTLIAFFGTVESPIVLAAGQSVCPLVSGVNRSGERAGGYKTVAFNQKRAVIPELRRCATAHCDTDRECVTA